MLIWSNVGTPQTVRPCGPCSFCCKGTVTATVINQQIGEGKACSFIGKGGKGCTIHPYRPRVCRDYICGWKTSMSPYNNKSFPEDFRPDISNVIMTWKIDGETKERYLAVLDFNMTTPNNKVLEYLVELNERGELPEVRYYHYYLGPKVTTEARSGRFVSKIKQGNKI